MKITVQIQGDKELRSKLDRIRRAGRAGDATLVWAQAIAKEDRRRARAKGGRSFWADQARRIRASRHGADGAAIYVGIEGLHHHTGGDIFPTRSKSLTIPISDEAKGKRAGEFESGGRDLFTISIDGDPDTQGILGYAEDDGSFHGLYVLRSRVHHEPDPWLVDENEARSIGRTELKRFARQMAEGR